MREYKFRGREIDGSVWYYGNLNIAIMSDDSHGYFILESDEEYMIDPETVGQYTSLKDKNGKEIYEGDVISHWWSGRREDTVEYRDGAFYAGIYLLNKCTDDKQVIGNIYENPALVGEQHA